MTSPRTISILQITDLHIMPNAGEKMLGIDTEWYFQEILKHAYDQRNHYDLILVSGDLTQDPCESSYVRIRNRLQAYMTECLCLPGNHDDLSMMQKILHGGKISCDKQRLFDRWQLINLNSQIPGKPGGYIAEEELAYLETQLENRPDLSAIIAVHHHCIPTRSEWLDTMIIANSASLFEVLWRYPQVKAVTTGHIHQEMDVMKQSIRVLATPSTCFQFKPDCSDFTLDTSMPGYRIIELMPNGQIITEVLRLPGKLAELDNQSPGY